MGFRCGIVTENSERLDALIFPGAASPGPAEAPYTGDVRFVSPGKTGRRIRLRIENDDPHSVTILGIYPEVTINDEN